MNEKLKNMKIPDAIINPVAMMQRIEKSRLKLSIEQIALRSKKNFFEKFFFEKKKKKYCKKLLVDARASKTVKMSGALDVDNIIERLLEVRGSKPGKQVNLTEKEIRCASLLARCCCSLHAIRYTLVHTPFHFYYF